MLRSAPLAFIALSAIGPGCASRASQNALEPTTPRVGVLAVSDVAWESLNPARGDASPRAGTLWGNRSGTVPTGFLAQFVDGFSSPPHIHNVSYRGVVLHGEVHNDDPEAETMWMPPGSYWTQPAGEVHITSARGPHNVAFVEIARGPYLVNPPGDAFQVDERPINVDARNVVWLDASSSTWIAALEPEGAARIAHLWGDLTGDGENGSFLEVPAGRTARIVAPDGLLRAVVVAGTVTHQVPGATQPASLEPGSTFHSRDRALHVVRAAADASVTLYVRSEGRYRALAGD